MERIVVDCDLEIIPDGFLALARGRALPLSLRELELLVEMARNPERVRPREDLYASVWGGSLRAADRSVDVYVHKLRCKLAAAVPERRYIHTHFGLGYRFSPEPVTENGGAGGGAPAFTTLSHVGNGSVTSSIPSAETLGT